MNSPMIKSLLAVSFVLCFGAGTALGASLQETIVEAEQTFGGEAFAAETVRNISEVRVLSGRQIVEAVYNARSGRPLRTHSSV